MIDVAFAAQVVALLRMQIIDHMPESFVSLAQSCAMHAALPAIQIGFLHRLVEAQRHLKGMVL